MTRVKAATAAVAAALALLVAMLAAPAAVADHDHDHDHGDTPSLPTSSAVEPVAVDCSDSDLPPHDGFQSADARCVDLVFGEQSAQADNPTLLIVDAPDRVKVGEPFTISVSTRNLVRDRFLPAGQGGYYVESATLDDDGLTRGHFHTACRPLLDPDEAPEPERSPVFIATEDGAGGAEPDTVDVRIAAGLPTRGTWQCASWAGDGSHRIPMMAFANQVPAFDAIRVEVRGGGRR